MNISQLDFETDHLNYLKTIVAPDRYASLIPDGVIDKVLLKSDTSSYMITSEGGEGSFTIEFYPLSENEIVGAIFAYDTVANKDKWIANITRANNLKIDYNWIRNVAKALTVIMNTRTVNDDTLSGKMSAVESQVGISEIGTQFSYTSLLGIVNNVESKKTVQVSEGFKIIAIPKIFDQPFTRLRDDIIYTVGTSPGGSSVGDTNAIYVDKSFTLEARTTYLDTIPLTSAPNTQVSERTFRIDSLTGIEITLFSRLLPNVNVSNDIKHIIELTTYDLADESIRTVSMQVRTDTILTANEPNDITLSATLAPDPDKDSPLNRPIHKLKVTQYLWEHAAGVANILLTTNLKLEIPQGAKLGTNRPVVLIKGQGLPQDAVLDVQLSTVDEVVPNGSLQRNSTLSHPLFSPASRRVVEVFAAHGNELGFRPILSFNEYYDLLNRLEGFSLSEEDMVNIMNASTPGWLKKVARGFKKTEKFYKTIRPLLQLTPMAPSLPMADATYESLKNYKAASEPRAFARSYYAADVDVQLTESSKQPLVDREKTREEKTPINYHYTRKATDTVVPIIGVDYDPENHEIIGRDFVAMRGDQRELLGDTQKMVSTNSLGKGRVYGYMMSGVFPFRLRDDVTVLPLAEVVNNLDKTGYIYEFDGPICTGESAWASILIAQNANLWVTNIVPSAGVRIFKKELYLRPVANVPEKAKLVAKRGRKLLTTKTNVEGTVNKNYLRQAVSYIRNHLSEESLLPDEHAPDEVLPLKILHAKGIKKHSIARTGNGWIYYCSDNDDDDTPTYGFKKKTYELSEPPEVAQDDQEVLRTWKKNYALLINNLGVTITKLKEGAAVIGPNRAAMWEHIEGIMGIIEEKLTKTIEEAPESLDEVATSVGRYVQRMDPGPTVVTSNGVGALTTNNLALNRLDYLHEYNPESWPSSSEIDKKVKDRLVQFPFLYLNLSKTYWPKLEKVTTYDVKNAKDNLVYEDESSENVMTFDYNQLAKISIGYGVPPSEFGEILDHFKEGKVGNLSKEDNQFIALIAGKMKNLPKAKLHELPKEAQIQELKKRNVDPTKLDEALKRSREGLKNWEQGLVKSKEENLAAKATTAPKHQANPKKISEREMRELMAARIRKSNTAQTPVRANYT